MWRGPPLCGGKSNPAGPPAPETVVSELARRRGKSPRVFQGAKRSNRGDAGELADSWAPGSEWGSGGREFKSHRPDH